jgi:hypothetical protein
MRIGSGVTRAVLAGVAVIVLASGCEGELITGKADEPQRADGRPAPQDRGKPGPARVAASHCPADLPSCRTTRGSVVYVERVDPDGDGDAHFVVADSQGITLPGVTAIDVRKDLRPQPLPKVGDLISAAGPVQTGSLGQQQIHALELHVAGE